MEVGAALPYRNLSALDRPGALERAYVQPSRRPTDGRYGENPFRLQHYYQFQVLIKPSPADLLELYLGSLKALGFDRSSMTSALSRTTGNLRRSAPGSGLGGVAQWHGDHAADLFPAGRRLDCRPVSGEITTASSAWPCTCRGREHLRHPLDRGPAAARHLPDVFHQNELEQSTYSFEHADTEVLFRILMSTSVPATQLLEAKLALPAYEQVLKPRILSICSMRARRSRSPSASATFCGCARWPAAWPDLLRKS